MNQKGQAFSVFELMIAGVVAFAILIVLITVISKFDFNPQGKAQDAILQELKGVGLSGVVTTQAFEMASGDTLLATNFQAGTGYDYQSVYFCKGSNLSTSVSGKLNVSGGTTDSPSTIKWDGVTKQKFKAKVICETTNDLIGAAIEAVDADAECGDIDSYCGESQPCCAVLFEKGQ